jgi:preprotein translocase subunit SecF
MRLLKLVPDNTNFHFLRLRWAALALSLALVFGSWALLAVKGLNYGVDFAGGLTMEVGFTQAAPLDDLRRTVGALGVGEPTIQEFGGPTIVAIRLPLPPGEEGATQKVVARVTDAVKARHPDASVRRVETVSGKVSGELIRDGAIAAVVGMFLVALYIWFRFEWAFGIGALLSLVHDVSITLGFFVVTRLEFNLNIVAAVLTIIGYSLNDTIVVYDRIRENLRKFRKMPLAELLDLSVNETLSRTIVTSLSLIIALAILLILGGEVLRGFTAAMLLGIFIGTYSSIYIAAPLLIWVGIGRASFGGGDAAAERAARP